MAYHEAVVFEMVFNRNERRSADTEQRAELIVVQFSVTERSVAFTSNLLAHSSGG